VVTTGILARRLAAFVVAASVATTINFAQAGEAQPAQPAAPAAAAPATPPFPSLMPLIQKNREAERKIAQDREARFAADLKKQQELLQQALQRRNAAEARSAQLDKQFSANEQRIAEVNELLTQQTGNLGELFGVTRQVAGDAAAVLAASLLTTQFAGTDTEERSDFLLRLSGAKELPSLPELTRLWQELLREMVNSGTVTQYKTPVIQADQSRVEMDVVRTGPFTAQSNGLFLGYLPSEKTLTVLEANLSAGYQAVGRAQQNAVGQTGYTRAIVDPARGSIIGLYLDRPTIIDRIQHGESVNYLIIAVGVLGVVLAAIQIVHLVITRIKVKAQLRDMGRPQNNNPLGRVLIAAREGKATTSAEVMELQISEAVLRELPALERFQGFLRLGVAAGPLLGLIGTVIGMIITFKVIVASGSSDPKLMAIGIGAAMMATVLGLGIAIPLLFINSLLAKLSSTIIQTLDEESQALLATAKH